MLFLTLAVTVYALSILLWVCWRMSGWVFSHLSVKPTPKCEVQHLGTLVSLWWSPEDFGPVKSKERIRWTHKYVTAFSSARGTALLQLGPTCSITLDNDLARLYCCVWEAEVLDLGNPQGQIRTWRKYCQLFEEILISFVLINEIKSSNGWLKKKPKQRHGKKKSQTKNTTRNNQTWKITIKHQKMKVTDGD